MRSSISWKLGERDEVMAPVDRGWGRGTGTEAQTFISNLKPFNQIGRSILASFGPTAYEYHTNTHGRHGSPGQPLPPAWRVGGPP
jgi:hypothetical protein